MIDEQKKSVREGQQPEALAQFGKSARRGDPKSGVEGLKAADETSPLPTDNADKHSVAEELLSEGAHGEEPVPEAAGALDLPDRIVDNHPKRK